jgi:aminopeptidase N
VRGPRLLVAALSAVLGLALLSAGSLAGEAGGETAPRPGAPGIGDPYFPLDGNGGIDILSYDVHDRYDLGTGTLSGWTDLRLRGLEPLSSFNLDLLLPVTSVRVGGARVGFTQQRHELVVAQRLAAGQAVDVRVRYAGQPGRHSYLGERNWLANAGEVVAMNQPHMAPWWFPANDHPRDRAAMRISITVPKALDVVANGHQVRRKVRGGLATTTWRADEPMVPYLAFFAAGRFKVAHGTRNGLPWLVAVSRALPTALRPEAMALLRRTPEVTEWLAGEVGPYPFSTVGGLATSLEPGFALENQTRPTYSPASLDLPTLVHELAHQWFGDSVAVESWADIWLNEGAATFFEWRWAETHGGPSAASRLRSEYDAMAADDAFWESAVADPCPTYQNCVSSIFAPFVYQRGSMAFQALRNRVGEADFWALLRRWVTDHRGTTGSTAQFTALAEEVSGEDLDAFFAAWLTSPSKPADTAANGLG